MKTKTRTANTKNAGFTLVELMITMAVSALIASALYATYILQQRSYSNQGQVTEMQQNLRVGIDFLTLDLRMAGYDPMANGVAGITAATGTSITFTADMDRDGVLGTGGSPASEPEYFSFSLGNQVANGVTIPTLLRSASTTPTANLQPMADYVEQIEFFYHFENGTAATTTPGTFSDIRAVQVSILARAAKRDAKYTNTQTYTPASGIAWPVANDNFRRRLITTHIDLRNMGL